MDSRASAFWVRFKANRWPYTLTILATLSVGILVGTVVSSGVKGKEQKSSDATPLTIPDVKHLSNAFTQISQQLEPSVVNINTESTIKTPRRRGRTPQADPGDQGGGDDNNGFQDFFDRFFGGQGGDGGNIRQRSLGSGVIVDAKGYIVTNRHVVEKADRIRVKLQDEPPATPGHDAKVIGMDQETDLAVIKIETDRPLPVAKMGNSDGMEVGDWVLAIGSPFGLQETVTAGIVSAKGRNQSRQLWWAARQHGWRSDRYQHSDPHRNEFLRRGWIRHAVEYGGRSLQPADRSGAPRLARL